VFHDNRKLVIFLFCLTASANSHANLSALPALTTRRHPEPYASGAQLLAAILTTFALSSRNGQAGDQQNLPALSRRPYALPTYCQ